MSLPLKEIPRNQSLPMSEEQALHIIERASKDQFLAQDIEQLRDKCCLFVNDIMREVNLALAQQDKRVPALLRSKQDTAISLRGAARERERLAQQRRELAEAMVIGALLNSNNPDWNPLDPATDRSRGSLLLALLRSALP
jgi:hypothetical protein